MYTEPQTEHSNVTDVVNDDRGGTSPSEKRRRHCLSECDVNSSELIDTDRDNVTVADNDTSTEAVPACTAAPALSSHAPNHLNKENRGVVVSDGAAAGVSESPSHTFKSPPHRRNMFAQSRDSSVARQRFNLNATKDKPTTPEPVVEVRSRSVTLHAVVTLADDYQHLFVILSVCLSVCTIKPKRLKLKSPNLTQR